MDNWMSAWEPHGGILCFYLETPFTMGTSKAYDICGHFNIDIVVSR